MGQLNLVQLHHLVDSFIQKYQHLLRVSLLSVFVFVAMPSANGAERLKRIIENNELRVCIWEDYYAISFYNRKSNQLEGIDIELSRVLANELGVTLI